MSVRVMFTKQIVFPLDCIFNNSIEYLSVCRFCSNSNNNNKSKLTPFSSLLILYFVVQWMWEGRDLSDQETSPSRLSVTCCAWGCLPASTWVALAPSPSPAWLPSPTYSGNSSSGLYSLHSFFFNQYYYIHFFCS